jgi:GDP-L-fucose synthase
MLSILVTGSNGLVGSAIQDVVKYYECDFRFVFLTRELCDLEDTNAVNSFFKQCNPDIVIHLASIVGGVYDNLCRNYEFLMRNTKINNNVVEACKRYKVKMLVNMLSTCIFPDQNVKFPLTSDQLHEGLPHESNIGYAYSKRLLHVAGKLLSDSTSTRVINIIPTNIYGKNDQYHLEKSHFIPAVIHKTYLAKQANTALVIKGSGNAKRQFLFANDLAHIILKSVKRVINLPNVKNVTFVASPSVDAEYNIREVVKIITNTFNFTGEVVYNTTFTDGQHKKTTDNQELNSMLDTDYEMCPLDTGLRSVISYFIDNYDNVRR